MRHLLAILFLVVFSLQVVPVKSIGKLLCKQGTEEVQGDNSGVDNLGSDATSICYTDIILSRHSFDPVASSLHIAGKVSGIIRHAEELPFAFVNSIPSPPPDII